MNKKILQAAILSCLLAFAGQTFATEKALPTVAYQTQEFPDGRGGTHTIGLKFEYTYDSVGHITSVKRYRLEGTNYVLEQTQVMAFHKLPNGKFVQTKNEGTDAAGNHPWKTETTYDSKGMELSYKSEGSLHNNEGEYQGYGVQYWREAIVNGAGIRTGIKIWNETTKQLETSSDYTFDSKGRVAKTVETYEDRITTFTYTWGEGLNELLAVTMGDNKGDTIKLTNIVLVKNEEYFDPYLLDPINNLNLFGGSESTSDSYGINLSSNKQFVWEDYKLCEVLSDVDFSYGELPSTFVNTINATGWTSKLVITDMIEQTIVVTELPNGGWKEETSDSEGYTNSKLREFDAHGLITKHNSVSKENGEVTWENGVTYTRVYDAQNRLTQTTYINISDRYTDTVVETYTAWTTDDPTVSVDVTGVTLNNNVVSLTVGATERLVAIISPNNATNKSVSWTSSAPEVATVSTTGLITAVSVGTATITVVTVDGNFTASCEVMVVETGDTPLYHNDFYNADGLVLSRVTWGYYPAYGPSLLFETEGSNVVFPALPECGTNLEISITARYGDYLFLHTSPDGITYTNQGLFGGSSQIEIASKTMPDYTRYVKFVALVGTISDVYLMSVTVTGLISEDGCSDTIVIDCNTPIAEGRTGNLAWKLCPDGTLTISGKGELYLGGLSGSTPWNQYKDEITTLVIEEGVVSISDYAFRFHYNLTSVSLPSSLNAFNGTIFDNCTTLIAVQVASNNPNFTSENGVVFNADKTTLVYYPTGRQGAYTIPSTVNIIGTWAFYGCEGLTSVVIPESVTTIGSGAF
ncbi:MAG: Ig-like domain-containing protein, partial [Bacteroidales bacterium]|nr:Ig-like domain-containing protein [Bacteroidales bacterium]